MGKVRVVAGKEVSGLTSEVSRGPASALVGRAGATA
jgi:hypothetical protein